MDITPLDEFPPSLDPLAAPAPGRHQGRPSGWTVYKQTEFFRALALTGSVTRAADHVGLSVSSAYKLRLRPEGAAFRVAWAAALDLLIKSVKLIAYDRALNGTATLVYKDDKLVSQRIAPSDRLLIQLLDRYDVPERVAGTLIYARPSDHEDGAVEYLAAAMSALVPFDATLERIDDAVNTPEK